MMMRLYMLQLVLLHGEALKICQTIAFENLTIKATHRLFKERHLTVLDMMTCTRNWLYNDKELQDVYVGKNSDYFAKKMDKEYEAFGSRALSLQGIPVILDYKTWNVYSSVIAKEETKPIQPMLKKMGAISIVLDEAVSFKKIIKAVTKKIVLLGLTIEDTPNLNLRCIGLICLKFSEMIFTIKKPDSNIGTTLGLITNNIEDMIVTFNSVMTKIKQQPGPVPDHINKKGRKEYKDIFRARVAMVSINSTYFDQPLFAHIVSAVHHINIHYSFIELDSMAVKEGVFSSRKAIAEAKSKAKPANSFHSRPHHVINDDYSGRDKRKNEQELGSRSPAVVLGNSTTTLITDLTSNSDTWMRPAARKILNELINFKKYHMIVTPSNHTDLLKITELVGLPSITIPANLNSKNESMSIISLYYDEQALIDLAFLIISDPAYSIDYYNLVQYSTVYYS